MAAANGPNQRDQTTPTAASAPTNYPFAFPDFQLAGTAWKLLGAITRQPQALLSEAYDLIGELGRVVLGSSQVAPESGDRRFADPTWAENFLYHRWMQAYLAWRATMHRLIDSGPAEDWKERAQLHFAMTILTEALAPTNTLLGNPAALKLTLETGGQNLLKGMMNFLSDLVENDGLPRQVDKRPFLVGKTIAATAGAVVHRGELYELIQYAPLTPEVYQRPLLVVPPQINKFYILDLAPKRSLVEYLTAHAVPTFMMSWRDPIPSQRDWGLNEYVAACKEALGVVCAITGSPDCNLLGVCAGGLTSALLLGHLAAIGDRRINSASLLVAMLDTSQPSMSGMFATREGVAAGLAKSQAQGVLENKAIARLFTWLRPNDLVWSYWVNNYLMGKDPPAFDILFWNSDSTSLPAALHAGFMDLFLRNPLAKPGAVEVLGTPIDLHQVTYDVCIIAGETDHICSWRACHNATRFFGGHPEFILYSSGHVQTMVAPPGNPKARFFTAKLEPDPDQWLARATQHPGTWWDYWLNWLEVRAGLKQRAPAMLGSADFPVLYPAPGEYVHTRG